MKRPALPGKDLMLWISTKVIALSKSCTIESTYTVGDSDTKDDGLYAGGSIVGAGWTMENQSVASANQNVGNDLAYRQLKEMADAGQPIDVSVGVPSNLNADGVPEAGWQRGAHYESGKALITSIRREYAKGSDGSITISLQGVGALKFVGSGSGN